MGKKGKIKKLKTETNDLEFNYYEYLVELEDKGQIIATSTFPFGDVNQKVTIRDKQIIKFNYSGNYYRSNSEKNFYVKLIESVLYTIEEDVFVWTYLEAEDGESITIPIVNYEDFDDNNQLELTVVKNNNSNILRITIKYNNNNIKTLLITTAGELRRITHKDILNKDIIKLLKSWINTCSDIMNYDQDI